MEKRLSQLEVQQFEFMQQQKQFCKYQYERDITLQKNIQSNSKRFLSFLEFPKNIIEEEIGK